MEYIEIGNQAPPSPQDIHTGKAFKQWFHQGSAYTHSHADALKDPNKVFYLTKATGTGLTLTVYDKQGNSHLVSAATTDLDFLAAPFCLGRYGFSIAGTVNMIAGFYV